MSVKGLYSRHALTVSSCRPQWLWNFVLHTTSDPVLKHKKLAWFLWIVYLSFCLNNVCELRNGKNKHVWGLLGEWCEWWSLQYMVWCWKCVCLFFLTCFCVWVLHGVWWGGGEPFVFQCCLVEPCSRHDDSAMANMPSHTGDSIQSPLVVNKLHYRWVGIACHSAIVSEFLYHVPSPLILPVSLVN